MRTVISTESPGRNGVPSGRVSSEAASTRRRTYSSPGPVPLELVK